MLVDHDLAFLALFSDLNFSYTGRGYKEREFRYRLFVPSPASGEGSEKKKWPLLLWLHGKGESGDDNQSQLRRLGWLIFPSSCWPCNAHAIIASGRLAPQTPTTCSMS